jgi:NTE family protein
LAAEKQISLALGAGGLAKGYAHIGVIRVLEAAGYQVRAIAGSSVGALSGALYAAGYTPDELEAMAQESSSGQIQRRASGERASLRGLASVEAMLRHRLSNCSFSQLERRFAVAATEFDTGRETVFQSGDVADAVLATIAIPVVFPPRQIDGRTYVDGSLVNPVPVALARSLAPGLPVVAVVLNPPISSENIVPAPGFVRLPAFLASALRNLRWAKMARIYARSIDISLKYLGHLRLEYERPDVIIRPDVFEIGLLDQPDVHEIVLRGERAAQAALPQIEALFA